MSAGDDIHNAMAIATAQSNARAPANYPMQAVVVIHGMGEQIPMDTIRSFVKTVWESDDALMTGVSGDGLTPEQRRETWSKPDERTGSLELRRITTRNCRPTEEYPEGARTDFFELYWADLSGGSTWDNVRDWALRLLWRNPATEVPRRVLLAWVVLWIVTLGVLALAIAAALPTDVFNAWTRFALVAAAGALALFAQHYLVPGFGRVVRYTRARPENIEARAAIRERGLALLNTLHTGIYNRIIVVGHSLGSILAYDLISYFWAARYASHTTKTGTAEFAAFQELERAMNDMERGKPGAIEAYRAAQRTLSRLLRRRPKPQDGKPDERWLITDFITLGSPLAHAPFLLASNVADFKTRKTTREYPTSPPIREHLTEKLHAEAKADGMPLGDPPMLLSFKFAPDNWQLHHATPFAAVRWTNIHDPSRFIYCGDIVSGPMAPVFGQGVIDIDLSALRGRAWTFTHTKYWSPDKKNAPGAHIKALREALDLAGDRL